MNETCIVKNYADPALGLTRCFPLISNCKACFPLRSEICIVCQSGYFNFNNTCITACPTGTIPQYNLTCILPEIQNCSVPYLALRNQPFSLNYNKISSSPLYNVFIFNGRESSNDPVGYIPVFQYLTTGGKTDGLFRDS